MFRIHSAKIRPPYNRAIHRVLMPPKSVLHERMICLHPDGVVVYYGVDEDDPTAAQRAVRYLLIFETMQPVGTPIRGQLNYLTTLVGMRVQAPTLLQPAARPAVALDELHVFELIPEDARQLERTGTQEADGGSKAN